MRPLKLSLFAALLLGGTLSTAYQKDAPLTNNDVVKMVKAELPETTILNAIATQDTQFDLSSTGLQALGQAGVSSKVIRAMLAAESKKKNAAPAVAVNTTTSDTSPDTSSVASSQPGMPDMSQMMAQMPPAMRAQVEAAMARRGPSRTAAGGSASPSIPTSAHSGVPVPLDSPLYTSFTRLNSQPAYRMTMTMESTDPRAAQMAAQGMGYSPGELIVQNGTRQFNMHMRIPAMDVPGVIDDWEIRSVVRDGRAARLITSPAVPRILKQAEEKMAMELAMLDQQAAMSVARAAAEGPLGAIGAGMEAAQLALTHIEVPKMLKRAKEMFSWQCQAVPKTSGNGSSSSANQLTDLHPIGDQVVNGQTASAYEFYAYVNEKTQGTIHLMVAKDTGLPLRLEMGDPQAGTMKMDYSELTQPVSIEIPPCLGAQ